MMAVAGRSYVVNGRKMEVGAIGDIALDKAWRGCGVARHLVDGVENAAQERGWKRLLVLPNLPAERLFQNRWSRVTELGRWALPLRPFGGRVSWNRGWAGVLRYWLETRLWKGISLTTDLAETVWPESERRGLVLRDRSKSVLTWRYERYPLCGMRRHSFVHRGEVVGWIVDEFDEQRGLLSVQDACFVGSRWAEPCMARYAMKVMDRAEVRSVWMLLSRHHTLRPVVRRLGFMRRGDWTGAFAWGATDRTWIRPESWQVLDGDKDA